MNDDKLKPKKRKNIIYGYTEKIKTGCGNLYVTLNIDDDKLFEVFLQMGKSGGCAASQLEVISRLISLSLRSGIDSKDIIKHLKGIRCPNPSIHNGEQVLSCLDAVGFVLDKCYDTSVIGGL